MEQIELNQDSQKMHLAAMEGGHAIELSGTILALAARLPRDRQGWWECNKIVWNNLCLVADDLDLTLSIPYPGFVTRIELSFK